MLDESKELFIRMILRIVDLDLCFQCQCADTKAVGNRGSGLPPIKSQSYTPGVT